MSLLADLSLNLAADALSPAQVPADYDLGLLREEMIARLARLDSRRLGELVEHHCTEDYILGAFSGWYERERAVHKTVIQALYELLVIGREDRRAYDSGHARAQAAVRP